nr:imidazole glycerol phosphate synthase subunit HisF [Pigmentibacter ruber]
MLKTRIMPTLLYKDTGLVKGVCFDSWRRTGSLMQAIKVYNMREVDELIFLDISASKLNSEPDYSLVKDFSSECFMPLTVGGGISSVEHVRKLLKSGADKVSINTHAVLNPTLISDIASVFGSQCVVVSVDVKKVSDSNYKIYTYSGTQETNLDLKEWLIQVQELGAGEVLITSIDKDGTMSGYDLDLIKLATGTLSIPVIASGGAGNYQDMLNALMIGKASALAASSIYHFTEQTPLEAKKYLGDHGICVRNYN